ncbi:MAG: hypothetical protein ABIQ35_06335 [Verrucomicrobiota bacterium]
MKLDFGAGSARVGLNGDVGAAYVIESSTNVSTGQWDFLLTLPLTNSVQSWFDSTSVLSPNRFYRARRLDAPPYEFAPDFRLIDHLGRSRSLYYHFKDPNVRAVVLIFTGNGCAKIRDMVPAIKALTNTFTQQKVLFWLIDSSPLDNRSNILAEAISLGISNGPPILHDSAQLVGHAYNSITTPEVVAVSTTNLSIFYRGAIDDRIGSNSVATTQNYLSNAIASFLAGGYSAVSPSATRPAGCDIPFSPRYTNLLYSADIAPILANKCVRCHSPGNIAYWSMTNYSIVHDFSLFIRDEVLAGRMPPWKADPAYGAFTNNYSLTPDEARKLVQWVDDGAVKDVSESDPLANLSTPTNYPFAWPIELGQPDAILRIPAQSIPASGIQNYRYFNVTNTAFSSNVWLRAAVVRPTNIRVVHHSLVLDGSVAGGGIDGFFAGYVPGVQASAFPPNTGRMVTNRQVFQFQMHYITTGTPETDQTEVGFYLASSPPQFPLQTKSAYNVFFSIPANSAIYQTNASFPASGTLATNIMLYEMNPHMHLRGSWFYYEVIYPAGHIPAREILLSVPSYVFHWQTAYRLVQPKYIPKGSRIVCTGGWDNSGQNSELMEGFNETGDTLLLPNRKVGFGEQTYDEMFIGYLNYVEVP